MSTSRSLRASVLTSFLLAGLPLRAGAPESLAEGDAAWARRAEGAKGGSAKAMQVDLALVAYRRALTEGAALPARWRILRALYFKGEHTLTDLADKKSVFDEGRTVGEEALSLIRQDAAAASGKPLDKATPVELVPYLKGNKDAAACFLWAAVDWGKWALVYGKTKAAKEGAAAKIRDYATAVIQIDPALDEGGGYRVLGRLHHQTPSIPFVTGWASRSEALKDLRLAVKEAPRNFVNRLYLAEAMWDYEKEKRGEARQMLEKLLAEKPSEAYEVEDARAQEDARTALAGWGR